MTARYGHLAIKWVVPAVMALAIAAGALFLWPGGLLHAQSATTVPDYPENSAKPVLTLTAADPEMRTVYWSLLTRHQSNGSSINVGGAALTAGDVADHDDFKITPYGDGTSATLDFKFPPDFEMPMGAGTPTQNNTYNVVVVASDDALGVTGRNMEYHKVQVTVIDVDDAGKVLLSAQQPQVGVALTAAFADQDAGVSATTYKWEHAAAMSGPWTTLIGETAATYTPGAGVIGQYLQATASYSDKHGSGKSVMASSAHSVRAAPPNNAAPTFPASAGARAVAENSPPGAPVGNPVQAQDYPGEYLTYTLSGANAGSYDINPATGQIMVGPRPLNKEAITGTHTVTVRATDPFGDPNAAAAVLANAAEVSVTITINDVNEAPMMTEGPTRVSHDENKTAITGATYKASNPDSGQKVTWSLEGADAADLMISSAGVLSFKSAPNFEAPADADMNNVYMATVKATDDGSPMMSATRDVMITVINVNEAGTVGFTNVQPKIGQSFKATLTDPDGMAAGVKWEWKRTSTGTQSAPADCGSNYNPVFNTAIGGDSDSYTPKEADQYQCLQAKATYTDPMGSTMATGVSTNPVILDTDNVAPEFSAMQTTRYIQENSAANTPLVANLKRAQAKPIAGNTADTLINYTTADPVVATDANPDDTLTYTLGGPDSGSFKFLDDEPGLIILKAASVNYESQKTYRVTVTATDPALAKSSINVTIMVVDVNEPPEFTTKGDHKEDFPENGTAVIEDFNAPDPERRPVYFALATAADLTACIPVGDPAVAPDLNCTFDGTGTLSTADNEDGLSRAAGSLFDISPDGELVFLTPPNYEKPRGADRDANTNPSVYKVVIKASDDATGAGSRTTGDMKPEDPIKYTLKRVIVTVDNKEEPAVIILEGTNALRRFAQDGKPITATISDGDGDPSGETWEWHNVSPGGALTPIPGDNQTGDRIDTNDAANTSTFTPVTGDVGTVRVKVTYTQNGKSHTDNKSVTVLAQYLEVDSNGKPLTTRNADDAAPVFTATPDSTATNSARSVREGESVPTIVGAPVTAEDVKTAVLADDAKLTYTLGAPDSDNNDNTLFKIHRQTGQLTTAAVLDAEGLSDRDTSQGSPGLQLRVTVTATDPSGNSSGTHTVDITVLSKNEAPWVTQGRTRITVDENDATLVTGTVGPDTSPTYMAKDQESTMVDDTGTTAIDEKDTCTASSSGSKCIWSLEGPDAGSFTITPDDATTATVNEGGVLTFKNKKGPDYEAPADANGDNVYLVTVVATDDGTPKQKGTRQVVVTVTNVEESGTVTLSSYTPKVRTPLTAEMIDPDGGVSGKKWQWSITARHVSLPTCPDQTDETAPWTAIKGATMPTYTPKPADVGQCLQAEVTYTDAYASVVYDDKDDETARARTTAPVIAYTDNVAPEFPADETGKRSVMENSGAGTNVGKPVQAKDYNSDKLTYTLSGADAASFTIGQDDPATTATDEGGQIMVKAGAKLDLETKGVYMVTVTATDPNKLEASIAVTITLTDQDEAPSITARVGGLSVTGPSARADYQEKGTDAVATYMAHGPNAASAVWSLEGDDAGDFTINGGTLAFVSSPNYEAPADMDGNNEYKVTVKATVGEYTDMKSVTVTVNNVDDMGEVTISSMTPLVGDTLTATLADEDGSVRGVAWEWSKSTTMTGEFTAIDGATGTDYEAKAEDVGYHLKAKATYTDLFGPTAVAMETTAQVVHPNRAPELSAESYTAMVAENAAAGTTVTTITATDADDDTLTYALSGEGNENFAIGSDGMVTVADGATIDFETMASYSLMVTVSDGELSDTATLTITVTDVVENSAPDFGMETTTREVAENSELGTDVGAPVAATDADAGDTLTYELSGTDMASFALDTATGQLTTAALVDYETQKQYMVTVTVDDGSGQPNSSASIDVTINVTNMDEDGKLTLSSMEPKIGEELTATLTDGDGFDADAVKWQWSRSMTSDGTFTHISAETMTYTPVADDVGYYLMISATYTDGSGPEDKKLDVVTDKPVPDPYDTNGTPGIQRDEIITAIRDYNAGKISRDRIIELIRLYNSGS